MEESAADSPVENGDATRADRPETRQTETPPPETTHARSIHAAPPPSPNYAPEPIPPSHQLPSAPRFDFDVMTAEFFAWFRQRRKHHRMGILAVLGLLAALAAIGLWIYDKLPGITHQKPVVHKLWVDDSTVPEGDKEVLLSYQLSVSDDQIRNFRWTCNNKGGRILPGGPPFFLSTKDIHPRGFPEEIKLSLMVEDNDGVWSTKSDDLIIKIVPANQYYRKPKVKDIAYAPVAPIKVGDPVTLFAEASDPDGHPLTYEWKSLDQDVPIEARGASATLRTDKMEFSNNKATVDVKVIVSDGIEYNEVEKINKVTIHLQPRVYKRIRRRRINIVQAGPQTATVTVGPPSKTNDATAAEAPSPPPTTAPVTKPSP